MIRALLIACSFVLFTACTSVSYKDEKAALDRATAVGTSEAFDQFIRMYPKSDYMPNAIYRRDRAALLEAKRVGTKEAFRSFLERYPQSDWADQARYFLQYGVPETEKENNQQPEHNARAASSSTSTQPPGVAHP